MNRWIVLALAAAGGFIASELAPREQPPASGRPWPVWYFRAPRVLGGPYDEERPDDRIPLADLISDQQIYDPRRRFLTVGSYTYETEPSFSHVNRIA